MPYENPFSVVRNSSPEVRHKFLEGQPYQNNYPGPFQGVTEEQQKELLIGQREQLNDYNPNIPVEDVAALYPRFNSGEPGCDEYASEMRMTPGLVPGTHQIQRGQNSPSVVGLQQQQLEGFSDFKDNTITDPENRTGFGTIVPSINHPSSSGGINGQVQKYGNKCEAVDNPLLDISNRPVSQFSHNNMVPFYGSKLTQNMYSTGTPQAGDNNECEGNTSGFDGRTPLLKTLELFTGTDSTFMHKRESGPLFSPAEQQTSWTFGAPAFRPDLDRYKVSLTKRTNESPIEKIQVGPGLGLDYSVPASGGFQQFTRILPNNVSDYKANQLEGRVAGGGWHVSHPTSQFLNGVTQNNPDTLISQARRPTMAAGFYTQAPSASSSGVTNYDAVINKGKQNRRTTEDTGFGGLAYKDSGKELFADNGGAPPQLSIDGNGAPPQFCSKFSKAPIGKAMHSIVPAQSQDLQSYRSIRETFKKGAAGYSDKLGYWECPDSTQGANRWDIVMGPGKGATEAGVTRYGMYVNLTDRGDVNPYVINVTGTASGGSKWNPNSYQQPARVTTRETTEYAFAGNPSKSATGNYTWSPQDARVTTKETTEYAFAGNPSKSATGNYTWSPQEARVTTKETAEYAFSGNPSQGGVAMISRGMFDGGTYPVTAK